MAKANMRIRLKLLEHDLKQWHLGKLIGKSEATVYRMLREELPKEEQDRLIKLIDQAAKEERWKKSENRIDHKTAN